MKALQVLVLVLSLVVSPGYAWQAATSAATQAAKPPAPPLLGYRDSNAQHDLEQRFMAVPSAKTAELHLKILTAAPHLAGTPEDRKTAEYVAQVFREAGLETRIDEYRVWMDYPGEVRVETLLPDGSRVIGPTREHIPGDPFQNDPRVIPAFNGSSASGDVTAQAVYANYGRPEDFRRLEEMGVSVKGKIVVMRYGQNFRGVKAFIAEEKGAAGAILYSDPWDDGYFRGDVLPKGAFRPDTGVQRGSVQYMFEYPGDPTTPGVASVPDLPTGKRTAAAAAANLCKIPVVPLSYKDVGPLMQNLGGPESPREWQGALPFTYHVGPGPVQVHLKVEHNYAFRPIWNVIGTARGTAFPDQWVIAGNHRDAWVYGAVDPNSGTAAMLEAARGLGALLRSGWKPKRTIVLASWDAEEQGLIGSTEFAEHFAAELSRNAVAYFNTDVAVAGPTFGASAVPSLKQFVREVTKAVPSPAGGTVYDAWRSAAERLRRQAADAEVYGLPRRAGVAQVSKDVTVGDLGSGSDYTPFLQNLGIAATDIGSGGASGVYHSVFDNFAVFRKFIDPTFEYEQQMARVFGVQILRMAQADVLPFDYEEYGREVRAYLLAAKRRIEQTGWKTKPDLEPAFDAAERFAAAGKTAMSRQKSNEDPAKLNVALIHAERALLTDGLPRRPFYRHAIYAPGEYTGYQPVVLPGVNEAIDRGDAQAASAAVRHLTAALDRAADVLEAAASD